MTGTIFDIKEMAVHDGPGIRTTVFFKGCPLRCMWCHNPEGFICESQLMYKKARCTRCGKCMTKCNHDECKPYGRCIYMCPENCLEITGEKVGAQDLAQKLKRTADVLSDGFGGFTFSGGEPLMQHEFLLALANKLGGYHLCIETSGYADENIFKKVIDAVDLVIMDIKIADSEKHMEYTGVGNKKILRNFEILKASKKDCVIRTPLIPGVTDTNDNLKKIAELTDGLEWEKLPYNQLAGVKYEMLGMKYPMKL